MLISHLHLPCNTLHTLKARLHLPWNPRCAPFYTPPFTRPETPPLKPPLHFPYTPFHTPYTLTQHHSAAVLIAQTLNLPELHHPPLHHPLSSLQVTPLPFAYRTAQAPSICL